MPESEETTSSGVPQGSEVDESICTEFRHSWGDGPRKTIEQCLPDERIAGYRATLEELVCMEMEFSWRDFDRRRYATRTSPGGSTVAWRPPSSVEAYCSRFPVLQTSASVARLIRQEFTVRLRFHDAPAPEEYRARFPEIPVEELLSDVVAAAAETGSESSLTARRAHDDEIALPVIPGYQLERRIGMGGMGVVYRARQRAANRTVALKLIRADRLETLSQQEKRDVIDRLAVEAQATARLEHPHVISLFEVNFEDPQRPWFSMQFVDGVTLADRLRNGPMTSREAAQITLQITEAIQCAHENGVLHRDLKPQNVFLRSADGQVLVGDFGLAKIKLDDAQRTSHEDILGTPAYMAPEQVQDSAGVTEAADLWSIGATLYHLLTGRSPFQAATAMETLRQVLEYEPIGPRQLNPAVDRDLETICLKCLQKHPVQRYESATALREDIEAYLERRPIAARPVGTGEKVWRWCRRNPRPAAFAAVAVISVLAAMGALLAGYRTAESALEQSLASLSRERRAREDADASHALARATVDDLFTEVSETVLLNKPGMQPLRRRLLNRTLDYYRVFAESGRNTPAMQSELGHVWYRIGLIERELGRLDAAETAFAAALSMQQKRANTTDSGDEMLALSSTLNGLGILRMKQQRFADARGLFERTLALRRQLVDRAPDNLELGRLYANTVMNLGTVDRNEARPGNAREKFQEAGSDYRALLHRAGDDPQLTKRLQRALARALFNSANAAVDAERADDEEIRTLLGESSRLFREVLQEEPDSYPDRRHLAWCLLLQVECAADPAEVRACFRDAIEQLERLVAENRNVPELTIELAQVELSRGRVAADEGRFEQAAEDFESGRNRLRKLAPNAAPTRDRDLAVFLGELTLARIGTGQTTTDQLTIALQEIQRQLAIHADDEELLLLQRQLRLARQPVAL